MKVARTVLSGGKDGDNFKVLPIATVKRNHVQKMYMIIKQLCLVSLFYV
ncbi:TPA: hypothetical protein ACTZ5V_005130 [Bacillus cereus]